MDRSIRHASALLAALTIAIVIGAQTLAIPVLASPRWSDWSTPVALSTLNTPAEEQTPAVSRDGLTLYFSSDRAGGQGGTDIWVSYRASTDATWGAPVNLGATVNSSANENSPALSRDEHWLFMSGNRTGGMGGSDIWVSYRQHRHDDFGEFGWQPPTPVAGVNTAIGEASASYFQDDESGQVFLFFQSNRPGGLGSNDIYVAVQQPDGSFGAVANVTALNSPGNDQRPTISHDGLEIFLMSNRAGGLSHIWTSTRETTTSAWSTPTEVTSVKSAMSDQYPYLAPDRQTLYFGRSSGVGAPGDLYVATRTKQTGKP